MSAEPGTPRLISARPNLHVVDVERSAAFYRDVLGFQIEAMMGDPPSFALLRGGGAEIAINLDASRTPTGCYIYVEGVAALHDACVAAGVPVVYPMTVEPWGLRNFVIEDPDGHRIAIGQHT